MEGLRRSRPANNIGRKEGSIRLIVRKLCGMNSGYAFFGVQSGVLGGNCGDNSDARLPSAGYEPVASSAVRGLGKGSLLAPPPVSQNDLGPVAALWGPTSGGSRDVAAPSGVRR